MVSIRKQEIERARIINNKGDQVKVYKSSMINEFYFFADADGFGMGYE